VLQAAASAAGLVPVACVAKIARELLGSRPADEGRVRAIVLVAAGALAVRLVLGGLAGLVTHLADNDLQLQVRRRLADRLGRVPLGWFTDRSSGEVRKAVQDDVTAMHHLVARFLVEIAGACTSRWPRWPTCCGWTGGWPSSRSCRCRRSWCCTAP
jgi:ATP-binding cassette subfamily B protein